MIQISKGKQVEKLSPVFGQAMITSLDITKPLPSGGGRILDMFFQVLKYDVLSDCTVGG